MAAAASGGSDGEDKCYDEKLKKPIACVPDFVNAAYGLPVVARCQCYKTFYGRKLQIYDSKLPLFVISYSVCPWQTFQA